MLIDWPAWVCQVCKARLVPADLDPRPGDVRLGRDDEKVIDIPEGGLDLPAEPSQQRQRETSG